MILTMSLNISVSRGSEVAMIERLAKAGFGGLDFHFCDLLDRIDWSDERAVDDLLMPWQNAAEQHRMRWLQGHGPMFSIGRPHPQDEKAQSLCIPSIKAAGRLGVPWLVLHPDVWVGAFDSSHRRYVLDRNVAFFRSLLPTCEKHNVGIAIENLYDSSARNSYRKAPRFFGAVPEELCELIDTLNHPLIGACWDTGHANLMLHDQSAAIASLGSRLKALHIQENDSTNDGHMLPFVNARGINWKGVADGLRAAGYKGPFTFEVRNGLDAVPDEIFDHALAFAAAAGRHIVGLVEGTKP